MTSQLKRKKGRNSKGQWRRQKGNVPFSVFSHRLLFLRLCSPLSSLLAAIYRARVPSLVCPGRRMVSNSTHHSSRPLVLTVQHCGGRGGSVPSCSWEKTGQKGTDSGWKQSSLKSRALGREHRQWHLLSCQEFLGSAKFLPTLLTPFMRMEPGLGS